MLAAVRDSYWCKAVGCHPEPALMTPISVQVAASGKVQPMDGFDIKRALAAAEARVVLLPGARCVSSMTGLFSAVCSMPMFLHRVYCLAVQVLVRSKMSIVPQWSCRYLCC